MLRFWHLASLDAPTVAVVWTLAFARAASISLPMWLLAVLALAAWCFYIADRLLDAHRARTPLRARHHFHWKHRRILAPLAVLAAFFALALVAHSMTFAARERNSILACAALAYFTSVHAPWRVPARNLRFPKELLVGILFTLACTAPTLSRVYPAGIPALLPAVAVFIALAWLNCHAIETWESGSRRRFAVLAPAAALTVIALLTCLFAATQNPRLAALLAAATLSAILLALLDRQQSHLTPLALRTAADLVLLTPLLLWMPR